MRRILVAVLCLSLPALAQTEPSVKHLRIAGLSVPVEVVRDQYGVAHIYAKNQDDLFFAQGYVAATDRLFQMELWKRVGQGRLAEVLGREFVERDRMARLLRYRGDMDAEYQSYAPDTKRILTSFVAGINAYIREVNAGQGEALPEEFKLAGIRPEEWRPEDCLSRMAAYGMTNNAEDELFNAQAVQELGVAGAERLTYFRPRASLRPPPGIDYSGLTAAIVKDLVGSDRRIPISSGNKGITGSNNWTVSGALTASGKPILANDPHRSITFPSLRYLVHLVAPGWNVIGAGEPALPGVAIGHNEHIAWGLTIFGVDQQDLFMETLNPKNPLEYKTDSGWEKMRVVEEVIPVQHGAEVTTKLKFTRHGPVLWEDPDTHRAIALRWIGAEPGTAGYLASLSIDRARNWTGFRAAMQRWKLPPENMVYADKSGNIGEISAALVPIRPKSNGLLPVPGTGGFEWTGFIPFEQLPQTFNPSAGYFASANHKTIPENYKYPVGNDWSAFRIRVIDGQFATWKRSGTKITMSEMAALQNNVLSLPAKTLIGLLPASDDPNVKLLKDWNGMLTRESAAAALYELWWNRLADAVFAKLAPGEHSGLRDMLRNERVVGFLEREPTRIEILLPALAQAEKDVISLQGNDRSKWNWGALHVVSLKHGLAQFRLPPHARPGYADTVNSTGNSRTSFEQTSGASFRELIDLGDWDRSLAINTPGQSGRPGNEHSADLLPLWLEGKYFPLAYSRSAVNAITESTTILAPEDNK